MSYKQEYYKLVKRLKEISIDFYGERLISIAIFGSVAKDRFRPDSDIDILIVAKDLPKGRIRRVTEFVENIENRLAEDIKMMAKSSIYPYLSPVIKSMEEVRQGSPLFLDMTEDVKILYDRDNFFQNYIADLKTRLNKLGSKKVFFKGGYYWLLKPDYKPGDIIEL
jgi:predicted nucleotidyltransferase